MSMNKLVKGHIFAALVLVWSVPSFGTGGDANTVIHVKQGAAAGGDGTSWETALSLLSTAVGGLTETKNEIWVAGNPTDGGTISYTPADARTLTIRGGFAGTESSPSDRLDATPYTELNFSGKDSIMKLETTGAVLLDRIVFKNAQGRALEKKGTGALTATDCSFLANGWNKTALSGRALSVTNAASVTLTRCTFAGNGAKNVSDDDFGYGGAVCLRDCTAATITECSFVTNGVNAAATGGTVCRGSALYAENTPVTVSKTEFRANAGFCRGDDAGGAVWLEGNGTGSSFTSCLFAGNVDRCADASVGATHGGALVVNMAAAATLSIKLCTFGYNFSEGTRSTAGLNVRSGKVTADSSIFTDNVLGALAYNTPADAEAATNATLTADYSLFTSTTPYSRYGVTLKTECRDGSAHFRSENPFDTLLATDATTGVKYVPADAFATLAALDMRVRSTAEGYTDVDETSPAIDMANTNLGVGDEPTPNGGRANAGYYGTTENATKTPTISGKPELKKFGLNYINYDLDPYGVPTVRVTMAGSGNYIAAVTLTCKTGGVVKGTGTKATVTKDVECFKSTVNNVHLNQEVTFRPDPVVYLENGTKFHLYIDVKWSGQSQSFTQQKRVNLTVTSGSEENPIVRPPWYDGPSGGTNVLHVRSDASLSGTGADWSDALPRLEDAILRLTPARNEIWICGTNDDRAIDTSDMRTKIAGDFPVIVRGGFAGWETSADERPASSPADYSILDGGNVRSALEVGNASSTVTVERVVLRNGAYHGFVKTGAGLSVLQDAHVVANALDKSNANGRGIYCSDAGTVVFTNVVVAGQDMRNVDTSGTAHFLYGRGGGLYAESCGRIVLEDCNFTTNGVGLCNPGAGPGSYLCKGSAAYFKDTPVTCRRVRFRWNHGVVLDDLPTGMEGEEYNGGTVRLEGACGGSAFTNTLWIANSDRVGTTASGFGTAWGGALVLNLTDKTQPVDIFSSTFAFNLADASASPGAINLYKAALNIRNTIFSGNMTRYYSDSDQNDHPQDIWTQLNDSSGAINICYSLFEKQRSGPKAHHSFVSEYADVTYGDGMAYLDDSVNQGLVTTRQQVLQCITQTSEGFRVFDSSNWSTIMAFSAHLRGGVGYYNEDTGLLDETYKKAGSQGNSLALDAGGITDSYANEHKPTGGRLNMGAYGNTPWSTMSSSGFYLRFR